MFVNREGERAEVDQPLTASISEKTDLEELIEICTNSNARLGVTQEYAILI